MRWIIAALLSTLLVSTSFAEDANNAFALNTNGFLNEGIMPVLYTCDGKNVSPELDWTNTPAKTQSLVLLMTDENAPQRPFYHWVLYNLPASTTKLAQGLTKAPSGSVMGLNTFEKLQYDGPCPPKDSTHTYTITLYALDTSLKLPDGSNGETVSNAMKDHILGKAVFVGVYSRWIR